MLSSNYSYINSSCNESHSYLLPSLKASLDRYAHDFKGKILDLGCGNGVVTNEVNSWGYEVVGIDPSHEGIQIARERFPTINFLRGDAEHSDLKLGSFDCIYSLEVIEHIFNPHGFVDNCFSLLKPDGILIISTPYHGYFKNIALAISGKMDKHFTALTRNGHIKFFSEKTLSRLLMESKFRILDMSRVGRISVLAKSMVVICRKS